ncbi:CPBP family intramembrane glutamic endopeptidase [Paenibacillus endoradicis]|uniref:CPBP family intramembrane glutamic endopeptidase n=1 Tax=Paenibacillus endoradicis TaxID=2972487 RepID=UPI0021596133|nr:type II CAAX endopeptidase family protein [Paenibacillus endoradicis]MCR8659423.1 CPBP family intramembrane metalloprotease [Paenibacillus endoradicis]
MINQITPKTWKLMSILATISLIVFILLQLLPSLNATATSTTSSKPISNDKAIEIATAFAEQHTGFNIEKAEAYHQANKAYTGYIMKEQLQKTHEEKFENIVPFDQYQVNLRFASGKGNGYVIMSLYTGQVTGWNFSIPGTEADAAATLTALKQEITEQKFPLNADTNFDMYEAVSQPTWASITTPSKHSIGWYVSNDELFIGEAILQIDTVVLETSEGTIVSRYLPDFIIPDEYTAYTEKQDLFAGIWTYGIYMGFTFIFGVLAIIYAILYRRHTSFKYGAWLTAISTLISVLVNFGFLKSQLGLQTNTISGDGFANLFMIGIVIVSVLFGAVGVYFSFIAGDGLWKAQGFRLWPRFRDQDYGHYIWNMMKMSYLLAIILLGIQNVIYLLLTTVLGTWSANDASQSFLNFEYTWLYPAVAWMAAITEEVIYRYFGVGIFRRWFKNTWLAALIPSLVWAAGHTLYPLYPASTRILELVIIGMLFTFIMVKFGFIAAMFTHAIFNTILMSMQLVIYGGTIDLISSIVFIVLPFFIAYGIKLLHNNSNKGSNSSIVSAK